MEASRSTIIKSLLAREGHMFQRQLYATVMSSFSQQFKGVSFTKFKDVYLKNLKEFEQISIKPCTDEDALNKLRASFKEKYPTQTFPKTMWVVSIKPSLAARYSSGAIGSSTNTKELIKKVEEERMKSKDFWEGKSNTPHDWKAIAKSFKFKLPK
ncbi:hypothetical protein H4R20_004577 [Coemansia guatemalensis]|uniref:Uncharacterized protein n=1 Tax=Coemansia guatemalensis TaxID=2761395 RepID=A0A9W8HT26_9FUNG|nr:hypothetical protein H4R20_004577 [Coemansia guatemalensis]